MTEDQFLFNLDLLYDLKSLESAESKLKALQEESVSLSELITEYKECKNDE